MTLMEAVDARRSRRKYLTTPIDPASVEKLQTLISQYNHDAGPNMRFVLDNGAAFSGFLKSYGMFSGVRNYIGLIDSPKDINHKEKLGYYGELIVLAATMLGLGTCWVGGSFDRKSCPFELGDGESIVCVIAVGNAAPALGVREKLIAGITHRKIKKAEDMFTASGKVPDWFMAGMRSVEQAPSAVMRQPVSFTYNDGVVTASVPDISDIGTALDFGIAKAHFEIGAGNGKWEWGNGARFIRNDAPAAAVEQPHEEESASRVEEPAVEQTIVKETAAEEPVAEYAAVEEPLVEQPKIIVELLIDEAEPEEDAAEEPEAEAATVPGEPTDTDYGGKN